jgi:hypothetical protein
MDGIGEIVWIAMLPMSYRRILEHSNELVLIDHTPPRKFKHKSTERRNQSQHQSITGNFWFRQSKPP